MQNIQIAIKLMRLDKPIGIMLLLWPCLWSLWVSTNGRPELDLFISVLAGVVITRSAGCIINDIFDAEIDAKVNRTQSRPLAQKLWPKSWAFGLFVFLAALALLLGWHLEALKSAIPTAICIGIYPKCKKFLAIPQTWLAMTWGLSTIIVWDACNVEFSSNILWLFFVSFFWTLAFDTLYAMADKEDDKKIAVNSMAIWLQDNELWGVGSCYLGMILSWLAFTKSLANNSYCLYGTLGTLLIIAAVLVFCRDKNTTKCLKAFKANNWLGCYHWILIFLTYR